MLLLLLLFNFGFSQEYNCESLGLVRDAVQTFHYKPKAVDDSLSVTVYNRFIDALDTDRTLFLKSEIAKLDAYKFSLDNSILDTDCSFLDDFSKLYEKGLNRSLDIVRELREEQFTLNSTDTLYFKSEKHPFYQNRDQLKKLMQKRLVYDILEDVVNSGSNKDSLVTHFKSISDTSRTRIIDNYECEIQNRLNPSPSIHQYVFDLFLNTLVSSFDPHTNYFSTDSKSGFMNAISSSSLTFGLELALDDSHRVNINDVFSGSPAFKDGKIEKGDLLLSVKHQNEEYDVNCTTLDIVYNYLFSDVYKELSFTFRKKNGANYRTKLKKEYHKNYEKTCYSFLIEGVNPYGYIYIPGFYSSSEGSSSNLSNDLAIEINHLKRQGIKGLIIDLQYNGGGSIEEALKVTGSFIDAGPVVVLDTKFSEQYTLKDPNRGLLYDGPLVVLVNGYSASASELFASSMQNYNRAVVMGQQTFGKATMQTMLPLQRDDDSDMVKVTIEKMFTISGDSYQKKGITPDIVTPALFEPFIKTEADFETSLSGSPIVVKQNFIPFTENKFQPIIQNANGRIEQNEHYVNILSLNKTLEKTMKQNKKVPLHFEGVYQNKHQEKEVFENLMSLYDKKQNISLKLLKKDLEKSEYDTFLQLLFDRRKKEIETNADINEAVHVLNDLTNL